MLSTGECIMRFKKLSLIVILMFITMAVALTAVADEPTGGGTDAPADVANSEAAVSGNFLTPFLSVTIPGDYTAAGVGMRGAGAGAITIADIPAGAAVTRAYLYWAILDDAEDPSFASGMIDGNAVAGALIDTSDDPCWGGTTTTYAYRANVTPLISGNAIYNLTGFASGPSATPPLIEGASLVVIYEDPAALTTKNVVIYDGSVSVTTANTIVTSMITVPTIGTFGDDKTTYIVGDGQDYFNDETIFNGTSIAADTVVLNDGNSFNGGDGEFWDTDTYDVSALVLAGDTSIEAGFNSSNGPGDCLVHVAQLFSSSDALVQITPIIDIRPGEFPNEIYLHHDKTTKVSVLSSPTFDAPTALDWYSLTFGHDGTEDSLHLRGVDQVPSCRARDENNDGLLDLTCHFDTLETGLVPGDTEGILMGVTTDGTPVVGTDSTIVKPGIR
jgi:hypothetical protein